MFYRHISFKNAAILNVLSLASKTFCISSKSYKYVNNENVISPNVAKIEKSVSRELEESLDVRV